MIKQFSRNTHLNLMPNSAHDSSSESMSDINSYNTASSIFHNIIHVNYFTWKTSRVGSPIGEVEVCHNVFEQLLQLYTFFTICCHWQQSDTCSYQAESKPILVVKFTISSYYLLYCKNLDQILVATLSNWYSHQYIVNMFELTAFLCNFIFQCYNYFLIYYRNDKLILRMTTFSCQNCQNMILHVLDMLIDIFSSNLIPGLTDGCLQFIKTGRETWASLNIIFEGFPKGLYGTEIGWWWWVQKLVDWVLE